jgi:hypothetical protein
MLSISFLLRGERVSELRYLSTLIDTLWALSVQHDADLDNNNYILRPRSRSRQIIVLTNSCFMTHSLRDETIDHS